MRPLAAAFLAQLCTQQFVCWEDMKLQHWQWLKGRAWMGKNYESTQYWRKQKKTNAGQTLVGNILIQFVMSYYYIVCFRCGYSGYATTSRAGRISRIFLEICVFPCLSLGCCLLLLAMDRRCQCTWWKKLAAAWSWTPAAQHTASAARCWRQPWVACWWRWKIWRT